MLVGVNDGHGDAPPNWHQIRTWFQHIQETRPVQCCKRVPNKMVTVQHTPPPLPSLAQWLQIRSNYFYGGGPEDDGHHKTISGAKDTQRSRSSLGPTHTHFILCPQVNYSPSVES